MYRFQTMGESRALLSLYNIGVEEVQGTRNGKPYRGVLYFTLDSEGNKTGTPIKSSAFGKTVGFDALEERMKKSAILIKEKGYRERLRPLIAGVMREAKNKTELRQRLKEKDIDLYLRRNNTGRITGVTFIDHQSRCVLNGSRLGKEFSANLTTYLESPRQSRDTQNRWVKKNRSRLWLNRSHRLTVRPGILNPPSAACFQFFRRNRNPIQSISNKIGKNERKRNGDMGGRYK